jgi:methyl-accepting chemotaxis protein
VTASISQVLDVIKGLPEQNRPAALNAATEAARAGDQGRFAAQSAPAKRTQQSTEQIESMIAAAAGAAVKVMNSS